MIESLKRSIFDYICVIGKFRDRITNISNKKWRSATTVKTRRIRKAKRVGKLKTKIV
jgi:hypothetical protein